MPHSSISRSHHASATTRRSDWRWREWPELRPKTAAYAATSRSSRPPAVGGVCAATASRGYVFDQGFAVFLEAYEESREALRLRRAAAETISARRARLSKDGEQQFVGDPLRRPQDLVPSLRAPVGSLADKLRAGVLRTACLALDAAKIRDGAWTRNSTNARDFLSQRVGVGPRLLDAFFEPFFRGVFLSRLRGPGSAGLVTSFPGAVRGADVATTRWHRRRGEQLAAGLKLRLQSPVDAVREGSIDVNGETAPIRPRRRRGRRAPRCQSSSRT